MKRMQACDRHFEGLNIDSEPTEEEIIRHSRSKAVHRYDKKLSKFILIYRSIDGDSKSPHKSKIKHHKLAAPLINELKLKSKSSINLFKLGMKPSLSSHKLSIDLA